MFPKGDEQLNEYDVINKISLYNLNVSISTAAPSCYAKKLQLMFDDDFIVKEVYHE